MQPARRTGIRVIVGGEDIAPRIHANAKRIPKSRGHPFEPTAIKREVPHIPALALIADARAVGAVQSVSRAEILTHAEINPAPSIRCEPGKAVVWVFALGFHPHELAIHLIGFGVIVRVAPAQHLVAGGQINRAISTGGEVHGHVGLAKHHLAFVRAAIAIRVLKPDDLIMRRSLPIFWPEVSVALDHQQSSRLVESHADGLLDQRLIGK